MGSSMSSALGEVDKREAASTRSNEVSQPLAPVQDERQLSIVLCSRARTRRRAGRRKRLLHSSGKSIE